MALIHHIREAHLGFLGGGVPRVALRNVGWNRACCLCHLVVLPPARVVGVVEVAGAKVLRGQLYHIGRHPSVQPIIAESVDLYLVIFVWFGKDNTFLLSLHNHGFQRAVAG